MFAIPSLGLDHVSLDGIYVDFGDRLGIFAEMEKNTSLSEFA